MATTLSLSLTDAETLDFVLADWLEQAGNNPDDFQTTMDRIERVTDLGLRVGAWLHQHESERA